MTTTKQRILLPVVTPIRTSYLRAAIGSFRDRRAVRAVYRSVERELSVYSSPAALQELEAILARADHDNVYTDVLDKMRLRAA